MTYLPRFSEPWVLALLLVVPWSIYVGSKIRSLGRGRKYTAMALRTVVLLGVVGGLAGTEIVKKSDRLAVFFLLDQSSSIPEELRLSSTQWVRNYCDEYLTSRDEAGVIVFGEDASVELNVGPTLGLREIRSYVGGEQTDVAAAVRLAMAAFPQGYMRRMVVFSDGNETRGDVVEEVKSARADGIAVDVVPLSTGGSQEVRIREVSAPNQANTDEPFQLRIVVHAEQECSGTLHVYQRAGGQRQMLRPQEVQLQAGDNAFLLTQELRHPGFYEYEVTLDSAADTIAANNEGRAFTTVQGEPVVLYVEGDAEHSTRLREALVSEGLEVEQIEPAELPTSLAQLQNYDGLILSDVSSTRISTDQMRMLEAMVRDHGIGLAMIGGQEGFGAGGYLDTPVEKALPVYMDIKQRKILPRGALAVIMHTCEIQDGNVWAREIALAALNVLSSHDLMGALGYMYDRGDTWIFQLQPVDDKSMMRQAITTGSTRIGDMPSIQPTLEMAYKALKNADAAAKRVVMISDGDPAMPTQGLINDFIDAQIPISTVCIAPHSGNDQSRLQHIAEKTGGQYYFVSNPRNLPQIFSKEAAVVKRGVFIEEEFVPQVLHDSELLYGVTADNLPALQGYVVTMPKENATVPLVSHEGDPVLCHWRYGLGKSVAFTSDVTSRWAARWLGWEGFNRFWAQTVRWMLREVSPTNFRVDTRLVDGRGHIRIDAVDEKGEFVNFLRPRGVVTTPDFARLEVDLTQTGPGIYEGTFPVGGTGVYMANLSYVGEDGSRGIIPTGLAVNYSREYEYNAANIPLLERMAGSGGGRLLSGEDNPFVHDLVASATITPVWQYLLLLAACVLPVEIFVRRVVVPYGLILSYAVRGVRLLPGLKRYIRPPAARRAPVTGTYSAAGSPTPASAPAVQHEAGVESAAPEARPAEGSFGQVREPEPEKRKEEPAAAGQAGAGHSAYTRQLLAAKERARKQTRRTGATGEPGDADASGDGNQ